MNTAFVIHLISNYIPLRYISLLFQLQIGVYNMVELRQSRNDDNCRIVNDHFGNIPFFEGPFEG
jgi:hypothetical protein